MNYYNEIDPKAAAWLAELIKAGLITPGVVDTRSITEVDPDELRQFTQCHFFAGIGGWSYALRLAGWPDDKPVWTGSCPCQPFSTAGKGRGKSDERHLWPVWFNLIRKCRPSTIFGEQVETAINHGWLDDLQDDLERENYRVGAVGLPACSVGAPHIRQRLWFVADTDNQRSQGRERMPERADEQPARSGSLEGGAGNTEHDGSHGAALPGCSIEAGDASEERQNISGESPGTGGSVVPGALCNWENSDWLYCRDGKWRPVEPGTFPLANGLPERVVRLRGYGNAIVPQVAAEFIRSYQQVKEVEIRA